MATLILFLFPVDLEKAQEAFKAALQVTEVMTQVPLKSQHLKPSLSKSAAVKAKSVPQQAPPQTGLSKKKDKSLSFALKDSSAKSLSFLGCESSQACLPQVIL